MEDQVFSFEELINRLSEVCDEVKLSVRRKGSVLAAVTVGKRPPEIVIAQNGETASSAARRACLLLLTKLPQVEGAVSPGTLSVDELRKEREERVRVLYDLGYDLDEEIDELQNSLHLCISEFSLDLNVCIDEFERISDKVVATRRKILAKIAEATRIENELDELDPDGYIREAF